MGLSLMSDLGRFMTQIIVSQECVITGARVTNLFYSDTGL